MGGEGRADAGATLHDLVEPRRRTDVGGALAAGWTAVRYNGIFEDPATGLPDAHLVTGDLSELPALLGVLEAAR